MSEKWRRLFRFLHARKPNNDVKADFGNVKHRPDKSEDTTIHGKLHRSKLVDARKANNNVKTDFGNIKHCPHKLEDTTALNS